MNFKYNDIIGTIIKQYPNGLVDVDYGGTTETMLESLNQIKGGDCYYMAGQLILNNEFLENKIDYIGTPYLVHAEVQGQGAISNLRYGHAWIEDDVFVYDYSNNKKIVLPKDFYYRIGDIKTNNPKKYKKYNFEQAKRKMLETENYGCWDLEVEYKNGGAINNNGSENADVFEDGGMIVDEYPEIYEVRFTDKTTGEEHTDIITKNKDEALAHKENLRLLGYKNPYVQHTFKNGGATLKAENGNIINSETPKIDHRNLTKEAQKTKATELRNALIKEGFFVSNPNTSITNFGVSTYIYFDDKFNVHRKFRISDHSVSNIDRIFGEYHYTENTDVNRLVDIVKKDIKETEQNEIKRKMLYNDDEDRTNLANNNWENIKSEFSGLCFKTTYRTYQNLNEFSKNKIRTNIYQRFIEKNRFGENAFYYEWTEPKNTNELCKDKPSREFIENYVYEKMSYGGATLKAENGMKSPTGPIQPKVGYRKNEFFKDNVVLGREIQIKLPNGEVRKGQFAIVELNNILASHNENNYSSTIGYPLDAQGENVNDRNYKQDRNAQAKVVEYAKDLQPDRLITTSRTASGTPVITIDGVVISGNNRTMSIKLAEQQFPEKYAEYVDFLIEEIEYYGFDGGGKTITGKGIYVRDGVTSKQIALPILVRIDYDVPEYSTMELAMWNKDTKKSERPIDKAIKLGKILSTNEQCKQNISFIVGQYETFSEFYSNFSDQKKLKDQLISCNILTTQEIPAFFYEKGFTEQGKELIENLLAGMVLSKDALVVSNEGGARIFRQTIITSLPVLTANLGLGDEFSLIPILNEALIFQSTISSSKLTFEDILNQQNIFGERPSREGVYMNRLLASGRNKFKSAMEGYNASVTDNKNASLFGEKPTKDEIFKTYIINKLSDADKKEINITYGTEKEDETPFIAPNPIQNKISSEKVADLTTWTFNNFNKQRINKNMERIITTSNPFVNGNFFKEHPEKVLAEKIEETSSRWGKKVTAYRGGIDNVQKIDADENFINSDQASNPTISVTEQSVLKATDTNTEIVDNLVNAIDKSTKDVAKKSMRKKQNSTPELKKNIETEIVSLSENFAKLSTNIPMDDVEAFLVYQKNRGREVINDAWIEMTGLSKSELYSKDNIERLVHSGALNYFDGDLLPSYIYYAENVYDKKNRLVEKTENSTSSGQDKDHIIDTYGQQVYETQVKRFEDVFHKQYQKRLLIVGGENKSGLTLIPNSTFAKEFFIETLVDEFPFRWKKITASTNTKYGQFDLLAISVSDYDKKPVDKLNLKDAFAYWLRTDETIGYHKGLNYNDVIKYYLWGGQKPPSEAVRNAEGKYEGLQLVIYKKEVAEFERLKSKTKDEGNRLFKVFLDKFLTRPDTIRLEEQWNRDFNGYVPINYNNVPVAFRSNRFFDGFPGDIESEKREAVAFVISEGSGLLAYDVGVGKTPSAIFTISQYIDLGWCKRPMVIVPNQTYKQWIAEFKKFCGHIPVNEFYNLNKDYLENFQNAKGEIEMVAEGSVSIFTYEGMQQLGFLEPTIAEMKPNLMQILLQEKKGEKLSNKKEDKEYEKLISAVEKLIGKALQKTSVNIEQLGFDFMCLDEAHACKKVFTMVKGEAEVSTANSGDKKGAKKQANNEYQITAGTPSSRGIKGFMLTHYIQNKFGGNTLLLTATPFTNSPLEIYSMLSMIAYDKLVKSGIDNLKEFFDTYVNVSYELIINSKLHPERKQVILGFNNLLSLQTLIRRFINYKSGDDIESIRKKRPNKIILPMRQKMIDGVLTNLAPEERKDTILPLTPIQTELMEKIQQYANGEISEGAMCSGGPSTDSPEEHDETTLGVEIDEDSLSKDEKVGVRTLKSLAHARNLALSPYIFSCSGLGDPTYLQYIETSNKLNYIMGCIKSIKDYHKEHNEPMSGIVIYMDRGKSFFPLVKEYLVKELGFAKNEVGIMSSGIMEPVMSSSKGGEGKKEGAKEYIKNLFLGLKYNEQTMEVETIPDEERVKVLIGSSMIREGINLQAHSSTLFNCWLDWNPSDQKQLYGRIFRQGNKFNTIRLVVPLMTDSIDIFMFEKIGQKTSRINSIWETDGHTNEFNTADFNPSELKRVLIKSPYIVAELELIEIAEKFDEDLADMENKIKRLEKVKEYEATIKENTSELEEWLEEYRPANGKRSIENMVGIALEVIKKQKDKYGKPMVQKWQQKKQYDENDIEIRDYYSDLAPATKQYFMDDLFIAVRNLKRETRDFLEPSGVKTSNIDSFVKKIKKEIEDKKKDKDKLTSKEAITIKANEITEERILNKYVIREVPEVIADFVSLNYVLSDLKLPKPKEIEPLIDIISCPPVDKEGNVRIDDEALLQLDKCNYDAIQTKRLHSVENETGELVYNPERIKLHEKIIEDFKGNAVCTDQITPIAILTGGSPGSGKSTFLKKFAPYLQSDKIVHIDADEIRAELPEYKGWNAFVTHAETRDILEGLLNSYDKPCKHDIIYDGTMSRASKYRPIIKKLHDLGYKVFVVYMEVPMEVSKERALSRYANNKTGSSFGRYVPMEVIDEFFETGKAGFNEIKNDVEGYILVDGLTQQIIEKGGEEIPTNRDYSVMFDKPVYKKDDIVYIDKKIGGSHGTKATITGIAQFGKNDTKYNLVFPDATTFWTDANSLQGIVPNGGKLEPTPESTSTEPTKADLQASMNGTKVAIKYATGQDKKDLKTYLKGLEVTIKYL